ncbi:MAG: hypothetical protein ING25_04290 [Burkholderiales bacterium]|jgi:hypothetical protein|nr:hypothetical protein [Burkholderiales bacterium]
MNWFFWRKPKPKKAEPPSLSDLCKMAEDAGVSDLITVDELRRFEETMAEVYRVHNERNGNAA